MQKYKESYKINKLKISAPTWNDKFELPDGSCSVSDIQDYFDYITKNQEPMTDNSQIRIYVNKIENRIISVTKKRVLFQIFNACNDEITWKH